MPGRTIALVLLISFFAFCKSPKHTSKQAGSGDWISLFNGKDLAGWTPRGVAQWKVIDGVLTGEGGRGHIYADPVSTNFEIRGEFRITNKGKNREQRLVFQGKSPG